MTDVTVRQADWDADYERRKAAGQVGWYQPGVGRRWALTRYNSKSFEDDPGVVATYQCPTCNGGGYVTEGADSDRERLTKRLQDGE